MNKPNFFYYPIVNADEVSEYLSELYGEKIDIIDILFGYLGLGVIEDIYVEYSIREPEEEYRDDPWETMEDWEKRLNSFIEMFEYGLLEDAGKVTAEIAKLHAETEFEKYRVIQDRLFESDFDRFIAQTGALL